MLQLNRLSPWLAWLMTALCLVGARAEAVEVRFERVAEGVYAHVGELGPRTVVNEGLNATSSPSWRSTGA